MQHKKFFILLSLMVFALMPLFSSSEKLSAQPNSELKIAIVDYNKVFYEYSLTVRNYIQLKKEKNELQTYITNKQEEIANMKKVYNEQEKFYDEGRRREELLKIWSSTLELEMEIKNQTKKLEEYEKKIVKTINSNIISAIEKVRKDLAYDIVINKHSVFSVGKQVKDFTKYTIDILNK